MTNTRRIAIVLFFVFISLVVFGLFRLKHPKLPSDYLSEIIELEKSSQDRATQQTLRSHLAVLGRDDEATQLKNADGPPENTAPFPPIETLDLKLTPWREAVDVIAANHRLVMVMERHYVREHREWINAALPYFRDHAFTHYAAETIVESGKRIKKRGYPTNATGYYSDAPAFGNLIRSALDLKFEITGYDFRPHSHETREEYAATQLAAIFNTLADCKLLVHAGPAHVIKHETKFGRRWLASRLWEKTGEEPFTIWQWSDLKDSQDYSHISKWIDSQLQFNEPVMLFPPPNIDSKLRDSPYDLGPIDAIVIHPHFDRNSPTNRPASFPKTMKKITGNWNGENWPVVVSAYVKNEPVNAIPLDQVMLQRDESEFELWVPKKHQKIQFRVFDSSGVIGNEKLDISNQAETNKSK